jgi:hypothetical protein
VSKIILHLCAKEGSDSKPYADAGYDVRIIGEDIGVENYTPPPNVYGIIANPPCTQFSVARTQGHDLQEGMRLVKECLRIIWQCQTKTKWSGDWSSPLKFWIIENPSTGFLKWFLGNPVFTYCQSEYGASFTKKTALWGFFNLPKKPILYAPLVSGRSLGNLKDGGGHGDDRSRCPIDFAKAFFEANP